MVTWGTANTAWWLGLNPSEKYEFVIWDDEIPNINGKMQKMFQTTNQVIMSHKSIFQCKFKDNPI